MGVKRLSAGFMWLLLAVYCCQNLPFDVYTSYAPTTLSWQSADVHCPHSNLFLGKPVPKKDHLRVRYLATDASLPVTAIIIKSKDVCYCDQPVGSGIANLFSISRRGVDALRGPPPVFS